MYGQCMGFIGPKDMQQIALHVLFSIHRPLLCDNTHCHQHSLGGPVTSRADGRATNLPPSYYCTVCGRLRQVSLCMAECTCPFLTRRIEAIRYSMMYIRTSHLCRGVCRMCYVCDAPCERSTVTSGTD